MKHLLEDPVYLIDPVQALKDAFSKTEQALKKYVLLKVNTYQNVMFNYIEC